MIPLPDTGFAYMSGVARLKASQPMSVRLTDIILLPGPHVKYVSISRAGEHREHRATVAGEVEDLLKELSANPGVS